VISGSPSIASSGRENRTRRVLPAAGATMEAHMSKARDTKKEDKKKPAKSIKEKRKEKQEKKKGI
jgi:hypothetical protein